MGNLLGFEKGDLSIRELAFLLDVHASSITHWASKRNQISKKHDDALIALREKVKRLVESDGISSQEAIGLIIALKKTKLWRGINAVPDSFANVTGARIVPEIRVLMTLKLEKVEKGLQLIAAQEMTKIAGKRRVAFDFVCRDKDETPTVIEVMTVEIGVAAFQKVLSLLTSAKECFGKDCRLILLAPDFSQDFVNFAEQVRDLTLRTFTLTHDLTIKETKVK